MTIQYRDINDNNIQRFVSALSNNNEIKDISNHSNTESAFSTFLITFNDLYETFFPIKTQKITRKGISIPWLTLQIIKRIKIRKKLADLSKGKELLGKFLRILEIY